MSMCTYSVENQNYGKEKTNVRLKFNGTIFVVASQHPFSKSPTKNIHNTKILDYYSLLSDEKDSL